MAGRTDATSVLLNRISPWRTRPRRSRSPVTPAKIDHPRSAAGIDSVPDRNLFISAIAIMDHDALKLDRSAFDANLDRAKPTVVSAYFDPIVIGVSVYVGFA
jgi:hypothetical protein